MSGTEARPAESDGGRSVRIAAVGDLHFTGEGGGALRELFADVHRSADILVLCGDLTAHGTPEQMRGFVEELAGVKIPVVAVLGNHDCETGNEAVVSTILCDRGVHVLDGTHVVVDGVGFAGAKGFAGGFGRGALAPFGEPIIKQFVQAAIDEALKIENALRNLAADTRIALLHYAPIVDTVLGEPETIYAFLGSSRLVQPLDTLGVNVVFHGHAHHGSIEGTTPGGVPVRNVALPLLRELGVDFYTWDAPAPERRWSVETRAAERRARAGEQK
ncbi:MAG: metallophosphoesterase family protein, partial [Longimicrobiales bacterium]